MEISSGAVGNAELKTSLQNLISSTLVGVYTTLIGHDKELDNKVVPYNVRFSTGTRPAAAAWGGIFADATSPAASNVIPATAATDVARMDIVLPLLRPLFDTINSAWLGSVVSAAQTLETQKHEGLTAAFPLYQTILTGLQNTNTTVPPSGAVAGIYAFVDRTRGVWKAPANASISGIIGPKDTFTASQLDALNVDPNSGKSINAIRSFTGKGTLVWGARTLAGNDNEWRYVNVRRFFNFVEESIKKATEQFVFEPNDANTWVRVQAMIENFLTVLWRQGALQGVKPEHAFYVAVGLGKTMTPLDILEGRMIVEIGHGGGAARGIHHPEVLAQNGGILESSCDREISTSSYSAIEGGMIWQQEYPLPRFHFQVDWGGAKISFTEVTGLVMEREKIEYRHSDSKDFNKIAMPGMVKNSNITLKRGKFEGDFDYNDMVGRHRQ